MANTGTVRTRLTTLLVTILFAIAGCKKKTDNPEVLKDQQITLKTFDKQSFDLEVSTSQGYVSLNIEELPAGIQNEDVNPVWGTTPFNTQLTLSSKEAVPGNYPIKVVSYKDGLTDSFQITKVNLLIEPFDASGCNSFFYIITSSNNSGAYILDSSGTRAFGAQPKVVEENGALALKNITLSYYIDSKISVSKQSATDQTIPFTIECSSGVIKIPNTTVMDTDGKSYTVYGTGTIDFTTQNYNISYTSGSQSMNIKGNIDLEVYYNK